MGVRALDLDDWLEVDGHFDDDLALKQRLVAERDPESRFWWSHAFAACVGATLALLVVLL